MSEPFQLLYHKGPRPNFGDDLNAILWPRLLSAETLNTDNLILVGIGSILTEQRLGQFAGTNQRLMILGTGTSYGLPPAHIRDWHVSAVRGPLTAKLIGMPEKAVTDGAILIAAVPELARQEDTGSDVVFIPHHRSIRHTRWAAICREAGVQFVTPEQPVEDVLRAISTARLVLTESLHGAIVADTMRVPWLPVIISPAVDEFKWRDWCQSMDVPFTPDRIEAANAGDQRIYSQMNAILRSQNIAEHRVLESTASTDDLRNYFDRRFGLRTRERLGRAERSLLSRAIGRLNYVPQRRQAAVAAEIRTLSQRSGFLSTDRTFKSRLSQMVDAVGDAERYAASLRE